MTSDLWSTPERQDLRKLVRDFTRRDIAPHMDDWERAGELPRELHAKAGELGLLELSFPESAGGAGDYIDLAILIEELIGNGGSPGLCGSLLTHTIAAPHIAAVGNPAQVEKYVRPTLAGTKIGSLAITEPGTGSDVAAVGTRAVRDGDHYLVDGAKTYITSGVRADYVTTVVRTGGPGYRGLSLLIVDTDTPGFTVGRKLEKMGCLCSDTAELSYDGVRVPVSNLVGPENSAFAQLMTRLDGERLNLAVQAYATAQRAYDLTVPWVRERTTFGQPLAQRQVIRHKLAEMARRVTVARVYVRDVLTRYVTGQPVGSEVAMAKNTAAMACEYVVNEAVQIYGGMGYIRENEVERLYRDSRILTIGGGSTEIMNEVIAKSLGLDN
ncbi:acyl-CoA dehydrogenase family protein [Nocardia huaxiensis]|uniref:Acyl-CoA dehydrogenase family protein n=1 Tax=Nocardia huaxiensis TaxID=2755382 RepID=A0A7D6YZX3_9NOCA|nr:acyl-CoA dehydrogenase family protein [Nocardia huaxiensis]QLY28866.1 acyl-CoA dehydrogenase family protein [Nocardia huaxiensis]